MTYTISQPDQTDSKEIIDLFEKSFSAALQEEGIEIKNNPEITEAISELNTLLKTYFEEKNNEMIFLVAKGEDKIIGMAVAKEPNNIIKENYNTKEGIPEVGYFYVLPNFQNQGIGKMLYNNLLDKLREKNIKEFYLDSGFSKSQKIWTHLLGEPSKILKDHWGKGINHLIWHKKIT